MPHTAPLTSQEIDDGWCLEEPSLAREEEPYEEYVLETRPPGSGFEQAFWEQYEGRRILRPFGEVPDRFGEFRIA